MVVSKSQLQTLCATFSLKLLRKHNLLDLHQSAVFGIGSSRLLFAEDLKRAAAQRVE